MGASISQFSFVLYVIDNPRAFFHALDLALGGVKLLREAAYPNQSLLPSHLLIHYCLFYLIMPS